ncbi:Hypothetical protein D9617_18g033550 [Elsinoe fawcettii]|nr:Hypothetical protein D9617_18g033550 [Elsinoe fawcettii]
MSGRRYDYPTSRRDPIYEDDIRRRNDRYEYSSSPSTHAYPPPPSRTQAYRPSKPRRRWPPQPSVEEETIALKKEAGNGRAQAVEEVMQRGAIDQDPIILDVTPPRIHRQPPKADRKVSTSTGEPTPPTSDDDDRRRRVRRHGPKLDTAALPEMRRTPSPYSSSTPSSVPASSTTLPSATSRDKQYQSSKDVSAASDKSRSGLPPRSAESVLPPRPRAERRIPTESRPASAVVEDLELGEDEAFLRRNERRSARYSFTKPILTAEPQSMDQNEISIRPKTARRPLLSDDNRRHTDSYVDIPREQIINQPQKPHVKVANLVREASGQHSPSSPKLSNSASSSRASPRGSSEHVASYPPSPPRSPRASQDHIRDPNAAVPRRSHQTSAEGSRNSSPQASPKLPTTGPNSAGGWQGAFDSNANRAARPTTRLSTATRPDDYSRSSRAASTLARAESLPYPIDDFTTAMPEERDHQYFPESLRPEASPMFAKTLSRAGTPLTTRPSLQKHQSYKDNFTAPTTPTTTLPPQAPRRVVFAEPSSTPLPVAATVPIMPPCERDTYVSGYDDWYTLDDCPNFDICPSCLMANFRDHYHFAFFRQVHPGTRSRDVKVRCDFSRPWLRLAWLLTLQRQLSNLNLVKSIYHYLEHPSTLPCPDIHTKSHTWYTVLDDITRKPISSLSICRTDVQTIELLLPNLRGFFVPLPSAKGSRSSSTTDTSARLCTFRSTNNNRFPLYLDALISLHESAAPRALPDMTPFVHLVKHKLDLDECPRDNILQGAKWFYIPSLPEFTVCEDCHDDVIVPLLHQDRDLVMRFNRKAELLPSSSKEGRSARDSVSSITDVAREASCALYSARMRGEFARAVEANDLRGLSKVARARRDMEVELQRKAQPVIGRIGEVDEYLARAEDRGDRREVGRLEEERRELERRLRGLQGRWKAVE